MKKRKINNDRRAVDAVVRISFGAFCYAMYPILNPGRVLVPNWHIDCLCYTIEKMVAGEADPRIVINLPPRSLKTFILSICLPAWLLGRDPTARIICASYSDDLSHKFSRETRKIINSPLYRRLFPATRLNPKKITEAEFETTRQGFRLATSVHGTLTGRGGDCLIIDDAQKADAAGSTAALEHGGRWFFGTAYSRLDEPGKSLVIVTMQRLHVDDLAGKLIDRGWPQLAIPFFATEDVTYAVADDETYHRPKGEVLQPNRSDKEYAEQSKADFGTYVFQAQFQQNPLPEDGNYLRAEWFGRYTDETRPKHFERVILSCDPAGKAGPKNDFTAITVSGVLGREVFLLAVRRGHWTVLQMRDEITALAAEWKPDLLIVEDTASGMGLIQLLRENPFTASVIGRSPKDKKEDRMRRHLGRFESKRVFLPVEAPWLGDVEHELLAFPHGRYDDQVDAFLLFLDWLMENESYASSIIPPADLLFFRIPRVDPWENNG